MIAQKQTSFTQDNEKKRTEDLRGYKHKAIDNFQKKNTEKIIKAA